MGLGIMIGALIACFMYAFSRPTSVGHALVFILMMVIIVTLMAMIPEEFLLEMLGGK